MVSPEFLKALSAVGDLAMIIFAGVGIKGMYVLINHEVRISKLEP